jgi:hypothetical protein
VLRPRPTTEEDMSSSVLGPTGTKRVRDCDLGNNLVGKRRRTRNEPDLAAISHAIRSQNLDAIHAILEKSDINGTVKIGIMMRDLKYASRISQEFASNVLKLLLDLDNPEKNAWLVYIFSNVTGEDALLMAAHYADPVVMKCIIELQTTNINSVNRHNRVDVWTTALIHNENFSTIKYLIGVLHALSPGSIPFKMYNTLACLPLVQGKKLEEFLSPLRVPVYGVELAQGTIDRLFQLSVASGQLAVLRYLFEHKTATNMNDLLSRICKLDDKPTIKMMIDVLDNKHTAMLLLHTLKEKSVKTVSIVIESYFSRMMQYTCGDTTEMKSFLKEAAHHNNIIAWHLLLKGWSRVWEPLQEVVEYALQASSSKYVEELYEEKYLSLFEHTWTSKFCIEYAVQHGRYETVQWIIATLNPIIIPDDLIKLAIPTNKNDEGGSIVLHLQSLHTATYTPQHLFNCMFNEKRLPVVEHVYLNMDAECNNWSQNRTPTTLNRFDDVFMLLLIRLREQRQRGTAPLVHVNGKDKNVQAGWKYMIDFDAKIRDGLQQALPPALVAIVVGFSRSPFEATLRRNI